MIEDVAPEVREALAPLRAAALEDVTRWLAFGIPRAHLVAVANEVCRAFEVSNLIASEYVEVVTEFAERLAGAGKA